MIGAVCVVIGDTGAPGVNAGVVGVVGTVLTVDVLNVLDAVVDVGCEKYQYATPAAARRRRILFPFTSSLPLAQREGQEHQRPARDCR